MNTTNETNGTVTKTRHKTAAEASEALVPGTGVVVQAEVEVRAKTQQRLQQLEATIKKGWKVYIQLEGEIADAIAEIKTKKLYRFDYENWQEYCTHVLKITGRSANRALNAYEVRKIQAAVKKAALESSTSEEKRSPGTDFRDLNKNEVRSLEGVPAEEKPEAVEKLMQTPAPVPPRTPRMPPPRIVESVPAEPVTPKEPELQKATCPLDNAQINWVVHEIERCYIENKAKWNKIPPPAPMSVVSAIQHQLQKWKL